MYQPFLDELPDFVQKLRRNLMLVATACVIYKASGAQLASEGSFLGIKFVGLNASAIDLSLLAVLLYHLVHFLWASSNQYTKWKLRKSGVRNRVTKLDLDQDGIPKDIEHFTLYSWWANESAQMAVKFESLRDVRITLRDLKQRILNVVETEERENSSYVLKKLEALEGRLAFLSEEKMPQPISKEEIESALKRFDRTFWGYQSSRVLRFYFLEYLLPTALGVVGTGLLIAGLLGLDAI